MSGCVEKRFEKMIYLYELGMLSEEEKQEFELHLYECDHCFEKVKSFEETAHQLRNSQHLRDEIARMDSRNIEQESEEKSKAAGRIWQRLVPASFAVAAIILLLLLKPFSIEFRPTEEAIASEQHLLVLEFENLADQSDPDMLGRLVANLLMTDLSESYIISVVSSGHVQDIISGMGIDEKNVSQKQNALKIAREVRAGLVLTGNIVQTEPNIVLSYELFNITNGTVMASRRIMGGEDEDIFSIVDRLSQAVKEDILTPAEMSSEIDRNLKDLTTSSTDAYRHYLEGVDLYQKMYWEQATQSFERALAYDSTFAMAYYYLSITDDHDLIYRAEEHSENISFKERSYILARKASIEGDSEKYAEYLEKLLERYPDEKDALLGLGSYYYLESDYKKAIEYFSQSLEIDPFYRNGYNMLAYSYSQSGELDEAIQTLDHYIKIAPDEANPHDSKGEIFAKHGRLKEAIASYKKAVQIKPDFYNSLSQLGLLLIYYQQYEEAESYLQRLIIAPKAQTRASGRLYKAYIPVYQGRLSEALEYIDDAVIANELEKEKIRYPSFYHLKSNIYWEMGELDSAIAEMERALKLYNDTNQDESRLYSDHILVQMLAENGEFSRAQSEAERLRQTLEKNELPQIEYQYALGAIEFARHNYDSASILFGEVVRAKKYSSYFMRHISSFMLARSLLETGAYSEAADRFKNLSGTYDYERLYWGPLAVTVWYYLARSYDLNGDVENAAVTYKTFLDLWKYADRNLSKLQKAKVYLDNLPPQS